MAVKKKKIGAAGRLGPGYGRPKNKLIEVEAKQRIKQSCPFCGKSAKRQEKGIWLCTKCGKNFTGGTYYLQA